ncbi:MAG: hypothetical protein K8T91_03270 [Planctomycetes bacterium]|nr:hypothetical protein [Planctomycetota bacterium]
MTLLEAIQLVQTRSAAEVSAEELALLYRVLQDQPALAAAVGGRQRLDDYLAEAEAAVAALPAQASVSAEPVVSTVLPAEKLESRVSRRSIELGIYAGLIAVVAGLVYWQLLPFIHRATDRQAATAKVEGAAKANSVSEVAKPSLAIRAGETRPPSGPPARKNEPAAKEPDLSDSEWRGWKVVAEKEGRTEFQPVWDLTDASKPEPVKLLITHSGLVRLTRDIDIPDDAKMLAVDCRQMLGTPDDPMAATPPRAPGTIKLLVDGQQTAVSQVPAADYPGSLMLALGGAHGRRANLTIEYKPTDAQERVIWRSFGFSKAPSDVLLASGEPEARNKHLRLWLRADSGIRDSAGRGPHEPLFDGLVQSWEDRSTGGRHLTSDTGDATRRPAYAASIPQIGGKPAVTYDATNDYLRYSVGGVYVGGPSTTLAVFYLTHMHSTKDKRRYCVVFDTLPSGVALSVNNGARVKNGHTVVFGPLNVSLGGEFDGRFVIAMAQCKDTASFLDINGGLRTPGTMPHVRSETSIVLGTPSAVPPSFGGYPGQIAELLIYDRALSDVECRQVGQYLSRRYNIPGGY